MKKDEFGFTGWIGQSFLAVIGFGLILLAAVAFSGITEILDNPLKILSFAAPVILLYAIILGFIYLIIGRPDNTIEKIKKITEQLENTTNNVVQDKRFIQDDLLALLEEKADAIWVITTSLHNEVYVDKIKKTVKENLAKDKKYTYFLPDLSIRHFRDFENNYRDFINSDIYKNYNHNINLVHMPPETLFLLEEVVIFNPEKPEISESNADGLNGFTYYKGTKNEEELHMKIEGEMLQFVCSGLKNVLREQELDNSMDYIFRSFSDLTEDVKVGLVDFKYNILNRRQTKYNSFLSALDNSGCGEKTIRDIKLKLQKHIIMDT